jgi:CarD family transcriptional regulator
MVIRILSNDMLVLLPVDESFPNTKIRKITDKKRLKDVFSILEETDPEIEKNWKARKENNQQLILSGDLVDFAEIVKTLYEKNRDKPLSYTEKGTIKRVFSFMVNEICIINNDNQKQTVISLLEKLGDDKEMNEFLRTNL